MVCDGRISCLVPFHSHCFHTVEHCMHFAVWPKTEKETKIEIISELEN